MVTTDCHRFLSPMKLWKTFKTISSFLTLATVILIFMHTSPKGVTLLHGTKEKDGIYMNILINGSISEDFFFNKCKKEDLYQVSYISPANQVSFVPTSGKIGCPRVLRPTNLTFPLTALLSFPGSGNTWTRHLLQQLTGIPTGSVYNDTTLRLNGFPFEGKDHDVIAVKTHGSILVSPSRKFKRVILLVRNVFDSILAETRRTLNYGNHTASARVDTKSPQWRASLVGYLRKWDRIMREGLSFGGPTLIIFYEDLKSQLLTQLRRIADFLTCDHLKEFSFCCALQDKEGAFRRKMSKQTVENVYSKDDRILVNKYIQHIADLCHKTHPNLSQRILSFRMHVNSVKLSFKVIGKKMPFRIM